MARTTPESLRQIVEAGPNQELTEFIDLAFRVVERHLTSLGTLDESLITDIEKYLAAHFFSVSFPQLTSEQGVGLSGSRHMPALGKGFNSTTFGQQAVMLDSTGTLGRLSGKRIVFEVV